MKTFTYVLKSHFKFIFSASNEKVKNKDNAIIRFFFFRILFNVLKEHTYQMYDATDSGKSQMYFDVY